jgi:NAD(P)-dependent dehydrogenase (short-subunit alcohol dehydrogenase family)
MRLIGKVIVVTGGANGIGRALCRRFAAEGAAAIVVADIDVDGARRVATEIGGVAIETDVTKSTDVDRLVAHVTRDRGRIDLFCSNAGIAVDGDETTSDREWQQCWDVNVMAHVLAARAVLPGMLERGEGYLLQTVSAAGLLTHPFAATYAVTKHASLAFAEWLSIAYGDRGIKVSALCPQGVKTDMLMRARDRANERDGARDRDGARGFSDGARGHDGARGFSRATFLLDTALEPEQVADDVVKGLADERFLILPHPEVAEYFRRKAGDYDRWLRGMRRLR